MTCEAAYFDPCEDFPHDLRGYFIASLGCFCLGLGCGRFVSTLLSWPATGRFSWPEVVCGAGAVFWTLAVFGPPAAYFRHSWVSKLAFVAGLAGCVWALMGRAPG